MIDYLRNGRIHLSGLRMLAPHLSGENCRQLLESAVHNPKAQIEELCVRVKPKPLVPDAIRKLPGSAVSVPAASAPPLIVTPPPAPKPMQPLAEDAFRVQFTAGRQLRDKLKRLQALIWHSVPNGDLATLLEATVDLLTEKVEKQRFGAKRARVRSEVVAAPVAARGSETKEVRAPSRHIPHDIKRQVRRRDGDRCTFRSIDGERCPETALLQFHHLDGFARTRTHSAERIVLKCRAHNLFAAEQMYGPGPGFMRRAMTRGVSHRGGDGASLLSAMPETYCGAPQTSHASRVARSSAVREGAPSGGIAQP